MTIKKKSKRNGPKVKNALAKISLINKWELKKQKRLNSWILEEPSFVRLLESPLSFNISIYLERQNT